MKVQIRDLSHRLGELRDTMSETVKEMYKVIDMIDCGATAAYTRGYMANMTRGEIDHDMPVRADSETFRITLYQDGAVDVMCFALPDIDGIREGRYDGVDALPNWVQERLAILMMIDYRIKPTPHIADVGRRISAGVFWVYSPKATPEEESRP